VAHEEPASCRGEGDDELTPVGRVALAADKAPALMIRSWARQGAGPRVIGGRPVAALSELVSGLDAEMARLGYKDSTTVRYRGCWRRLQRYFAARGAEEFSLEMAMGWVDEACGFFAKEQAGTLRQTDAYLFRVAQMLREYEAHGAVLRRYSRTVGKLTGDEAAAVARFEAWLRAAGRSASPVRSYGTLAGEFAGFCGTRGGLARCDAGTVGAFAATLAGYQAKAVEQKLCALRSFLRFASGEGLAASAVAGAVPAVPSRKQARIPSVWEPGDVAKILEAVDRGSPCGKRDYAIIMLVTPFSDQDHLHQILVKHARAAHVPVSEERRHGMHSQRHTLATRLMENGTPVEQIADILGHQSAASTGVYLAGAITALAAEKRRRLQVRRQGAGTSPVRGVLPGGVPQGGNGHPGLGRGMDHLSPPAGSPAGDPAGPSRAGRGARPMARPPRHRGIRPARGHAAQAGPLRPAHLHRPGKAGGLDAVDVQPGTAALHPRQVAARYPLSAVVAPIASILSPRPTVWTACSGRFSPPSPIRCRGLSKTR
jgi:site-specific recombinase XerD